MSIPTVTFDTNVWENIVDESKRESQEEYKKLFSLITSKSLTPYFLEGTVVMEGIPRDKRKEYIANYKANISFQVGDEKPRVIKGSEPLEITKYHKEYIPKAIQLGFRFLRHPRLSGLSLDIEKQYFAEDETYSLEERIDRYFQCLEFIEKRGAGKSRLHNRLDGNGNRGIVKQTRNDNNLSEKQYGKDFAEWADGDALAAHYGYGIDYFCTNDEAKNAGRYSVFYNDNLNAVKNKFGIKVKSPCKLIPIISQA